MLRVTGILTGSALAVAILIIALGVPEFGRVQLPEPILEPATTEVVMPAAELEPEPEPEPEFEPETEPEGESAAADNAAQPQQDDAALVEAVFTPVEERPAEMTHEHWYAFWSPFRSEIAANGFVEQLQRTTGLDYRVVKQKPGVYEVAFAYGDDNEIQTKLDAIAAATGLEMPDG